MGETNVLFGDEKREREREEKCMTLDWMANSWPAARIEHRNARLRNAFATADKKTYKVVIGICRICRII